MERLERIGATDFFTEDSDGSWRLRNVDGRCVFLNDGLCSVYPARPDGCVLYPLILYVDVDEVDLHEFCPHRHEFRISAGDRDWLRRSIAREEAEIVRRVRLRQVVLP